MKNIYTYTLVLLVILVLNGCRDNTYYRGSEYKHLNISQLVDISDKGYRLAGSKKDSGDYLTINFCKNHQFSVQHGVDEYHRRIRGNYSVNLADDTVTLVSNETDSQGNKLHCTFYTKSGYFEQKKVYVCKGSMNFGFDDLEQINSASSCDDLGN